MGKTKCKDGKKKDADAMQQKDKKYKCKKCDRTANKEKKLCKPVKN